MSEVYMLEAFAISDACDEAYNRDWQLFGIYESVELAQIDVTRISPLLKLEQWTPSEKMFPLSDDFYRAWGLSDGDYDILEWRLFKVTLNTIFEDLEEHRKESHVE